MSDVTFAETVENLERIAADGVQVARGALGELEKYGYGAEETAGALSEVEGRLAERIFAHECVSAEQTWAECAVLEAQETLRELQAVRLSPACGSVVQTGGKIAIEQRPEYWVGRLEGVLSALVMAVRGEFG